MGKVGINLAVMGLVYTFKASDAFGNYANGLKTEKKLLVYFID